MRIHDHVGVGKIAPVVMLHTDTDGAHADRASARYIGATKVADMNGEVGLHAERSEGRAENTCVRLRCADFVREDTDLQMLE